MDFREYVKGVLEDNNKYTMDSLVEALQNEPTLYTLLDDMDYIREEYRTYKTIRLGEHVEEPYNNEIILDDIYNCMCLVLTTIINTEYVS